jgi:hypothetical protein
LLAETKLCRLCRPGVALSFSSYIALAVIMSVYHAH